MQKEQAVVALTVNAKNAVHDYWQESPCGKIYATGESEIARLDAHALSRYTLEPYIADFARFSDGRDRDVLEVGVGMGADHIEWAKSGPASLTGVDLTSNAVDYTKRRLDIYGFTSHVVVADAENLPFSDNSFDLVYSWGVLHHTPDTRRAIREVHRVLRPGGTARIMIYHSRSLIGYMLYARYGLLAGHPFTNLTGIFANHLESPGTQAFTIAESRELFADYSVMTVRPSLSFGDLLLGQVGQRHEGRVLSIAKLLWPRWLIRRTCSRLGTGLLIEAWK
jgi:SAM-dependent methyltransferase